jgi:hypothetical protein
MQLAVSGEVQCQKKEDPAKPLQDLERAYLDGMMSAEEFEKQKQIAIAKTAKERNGLQLRGDS